jgi:hypothetical protein
MARVGQTFTQALQPPHVAVEVVLRKSANLLSNPKKAPLGHTYWHQKRLSKKAPTIIDKKRAPIPRDP